MACALVGSVLLTDAIGVWQLSPFAQVPALFAAPACVAGCVAKACSAVRAELPAALSSSLFPLVSPALPALLPLSLSSLSLCARFPQRRSHAWFDPISSAPRVTIDTCAAFNAWVQARDVLTARAGCAQGAICSMLVLTSCFRYPLLSDLRL
eukprot:1965723-Rhodomonas_salina.1